MRWRVASVAHALFLVVAARSELAAQTTARIEGTITDSVHAAPLAGATVSATRLGVEPETTLVAISDRRGRFLFDRIAAGRYALSFSNAMLDSIRFGGPATQVAVAAGRTARADLAVPSSASLRAAACPGVSFPAGTGALLGLVTDADTDRPLTGARVAVAWSELVIDTTANTVSSQERSVLATVDADGEYRLCGVPVAEWLLLQVQHLSLAGAIVRTAVGATGVLVHDLSFSADGAMPLAGDSLATPASAVGRASVAGTVRRVSGEPIAGAQVRVLGTSPMSRTDAQGSFTLSGLPAGTRELEVRQLGFGIARRAVELRSGHTTPVEVRLERAITLDSVRVMARRLRYPQFESRRKWSVNGNFMDEVEIESHHATTMTNLVGLLPGYTVQGDGPAATLVSLRSVGFGGMCPVNVVIDGMPEQRINDVPASQVGAIESYPHGGGPPQFQQPCGMLVIWTKR
ncbi:MAG: carboxypeptidase-like regulatory domain-containing protein [bacterium]